MRWLIPLTNSQLLAEVDEIDFVAVMLLSPWCLNGSGYAGRAKMFLHQFIAQRMGLQIKDTIDHIDRNKMNCKRENLRPATKAEQEFNKDFQSNNWSGEKCICWHKQRQKWHVQIVRKQKKVSSKLCNSFEEAIKVRDEALKRIGY